jgi:alpha-soluble NSF attachment protein
MLNLAIGMFEDIGRLSMAAKHYKDIADIYEKEENVEKAMEYYDKAAELYSGEGTDSLANQCKIKVAQFAAQLEQWASILLLSTSFLLSIVCAAG